MSLSSLSVRVAVACVGVLVLCSGLTACSHGDAAAKEPLTPSSTETTIVPPEGDPWPYPTPTLAPEASRDDSAGACAVAAYFMEATSYDSVHLRTDTYERYGADDCQQCKTAIDTVDKVWKQHGWIRGERVEDLQPLSVDQLEGDSNSWSCDFYLQQTKWEAWAPGYASVQTEPPFSGNFSVHVKRVGDAWKVFEYGVFEDTAK